MKVNDPGKLLGMVLIVASATVLVSLGRIGSDAYIGIIGPIVGYLFGNGRLATRGIRNQPVFVPKDDE